MSCVVSKINQPHQKGDLEIWKIWSPSPFSSVPSGRIWLRRLVTGWAADGFWRSSRIVFEGFGRRLWIWSTYYGLKRWASVASSSVSPKIAIRYQWEIFIVEVPQLWKNLQQYGRAGHGNVLQQKSDKAIGGSIVWSQRRGWRWRL